MCRPVTQGGLGIRHLQHTNMALLTKWVCRMMQLSGDLAMVVLREGYGSLLDCEMWRLCIYVERADVFPAGAEIL